MQSIAVQVGLFIIWRADYCFENDLELGLEYETELNAESLTWTSDDSFVIAEPQGLAVWYVLKVIDNKITCERIAQHDFMSPLVSMKWGLNQMLVSQPAIRLNIVNSGHGMPIPSQEIDNYVNVYDG
ncbi:MAG: hypothetical protein R3C03_17175 [Pirellulaceae bacterium]